MDDYVLLCRLYIIFDKNARGNSMAQESSATIENRGYIWLPLVYVRVASGEEHGMQWQQSRRRSVASGFTPFYL